MGGVGSGGKGRGGGRKPVADRKKNISLKLSAAEKKELEALAKQAGLSLSAFLRKRALTHRNCFKNESH